MITDDRKSEALAYLNTNGLPCQTNHAGLVWTEYQWEEVPFLIGECADCGGTCVAGDVRTIVKSWTSRNTLDKDNPIRAMWKRSEVYWKKCEDGK